MLQQPSSLDDAIIFTSAYKQRNASRDVAPSQQAHSVSRHTSQTVALSTANMTGATLAPSAGSVNKSATSSIRLSLSEIAQRRKDDKCFKCDELFTLDHHKHYKQLFIIEVMDEEDIDDLSPTTNEPTISLHALTGIHPCASRTMVLMVDVNGTRLITLLDSGSTHNFIDSTTAPRACVILAERQGLCVVVTNGDKLPASGCYRNMAITVHNEHFRIDCSSLLLGSYDMVLGVQWLESLWAHPLGFSA
jgi:hypothetical protein